MAYTGPGMPTALGNCVPWVGANLQVPQYILYPMIVGKGNNLEVALLGLR